MVGCDVKDRAMEPTVQGTLLQQRLSSFQATMFFQSVWMQLGTDPSTPKGWMLSEANKLHDYHRDTMGVHSCLGTSI
jgi:hypothetical protein